VAGCEYSIVGGTDWQTSTLFEGLAPNTPYPFAQYKPGSPTHYASLISPPAEFYTAAIVDVEPPVPGNGGNMTTGTVAAEHAYIYWTRATDNISVQGVLNYWLYQSTSNNISTVADCETNGTLIFTQLNIADYYVTGLTPSTTYWFNVVVADEAGNKAVYNGVQITTLTATLQGFVTIDLNPVFGQTLIANTSALTSDHLVELGTLTYLWQRYDGGSVTDIGGNEPTYTIVKDDIGNQIRVKVTAENCIGFVISPYTYPVTKAPQTAPKPELASATTTTITLVAVAGCEYNINGGAWQSSPLFEGLTPNTSYTFTQYKPETDTHFASAISTSAAYATAEPISTLDLSLKVFLEGVTIVGSIMTTNLQDPLYLNAAQNFADNIKLPTTDPYLETTTYLDANNPAGAAGLVVDWILVQIWGNFSTSSGTTYYDLLEAQALLLKSNGNIVDITGNTPKFNTQTGNVRIVIKHRNHLDVMSNLLTDFTGDMDYTVSLAGAAYRQNAGSDPLPMKLKYGVYCMYSGALMGINSTSIVQNNENRVKADMNLGTVFNGYFISDLDMDGTTFVSDIELITPNRVGGIYAPSFYFVKR
jgi:hypothetical protein